MSVWCLFFTLFSFLLYGLICLLSRKIYWTRENTWLVDKSRNLFTIHIELLVPLDIFVILIKYWSAYLLQKLNWLWIEITRENCENGMNYKISVYVSRIVGASGYRHSHCYPWMCKFVWNESECWQSNFPIIILFYVKNFYFFSSHDILIFFSFVCVSL